MTINKNRQYLRKMVLFFTAKEISITRGPIFFILFIYFFIFIFIFIYLFICLFVFFSFFGKKFF